MAVTLGSPSGSATNSYQSQISDRALCGLGLKAQGEVVKRHSLSYTEPTHAYRKQVFSQVLAYMKQNCLGEIYLNCIFKENRDGNC